MYKLINRETHNFIDVSENTSIPPNNNVITVIKVLLKQIVDFVQQRNNESIWVKLQANTGATRLRPFIQGFLGIFRRRELELFWMLKNLFHNFCNI
jgi:hypothetical protein